MPSYTAVDAKAASISQARSIQPQIKSAYDQAKATQGHIQRYQAGTDPEFNAAVDSIFLITERQTLNSMLGNLNTLISNWEADPLKRAMLGLPPI